MRNGTMDDITKFLQCKRVAIVGVSRDDKHFSRAIFREFLAKGYDAIPVNPHAKELEGHKCIAGLADIDPPAEAALIMTGLPEATDRLVRECNELHIRNIWIYKGSNDKSKNDPLIELCRQQGSTAIGGHCPMMFLPQAMWFHRAHGFILKLAGSYPH